MNNSVLKKTFDSIGTNLTEFNKILTSTSYELNWKDDVGISILGYTALYGYAEGMFDAMKKLIELGADVNTQDKRDQSPLHYVAMSKSITIESKYEFIKYLLDHGARVDIKDNYGNTPLSKAVFDCDGKDGRLIKLLLSYGADMNIKNTHGVSPLDLANKIANVNVRQFLT